MTNRNNRFYRWILIGAIGFALWNCTTPQDWDEIQSAPTNLFPLNGDVLTTNSILFKWNTVENADTYILKIYYPNGDNLFNFTYIADPRLTVHQTSITISEEGKHIWSVTATDGFKGLSSSEWSFVIQLP